MANTAVEDADIEKVAEIFAMCCLGILGKQARWISNLT